MHSMRKFYTVWFLILSVSLSYLHGDYLEVRRSVNLKTQPSSSGLVLDKLESEALLTLLDEGKQTKGYYHVYSKDTGRSGWVYRSFVRRYSGDIPSEVEFATDESPFEDKTYFHSDMEKYYASRHLSIGKPQIVYERVYEGYALGMDGKLKIPRWVQYELSPGELDGPAKRKDNFHADASIPYGYRAERADYKKSGFDMGHLAPAGHMNRNQKVMDESFPLSNMAPQVGIGFNRHIWRYLEADCIDWCKSRGVITIITGPIFKADDGNVSYNVIGDNEVAVPTHFYKIIVDDKNPDDVQALAFILPNIALRGETNLSKYLTSIDEIEKQTGLDFLNALPIDLQREVEANAAPSIW